MLLSLTIIHEDKMKIYGITTCNSVKKALSYMKTHNIPYEFIDLKKTTPLLEEIEQWLTYVPLSLLFNTKGTKFKQLGLSSTLSDEEKKSWLLKEPLLFKRPIIIHQNGVIVGFNEDSYHTIFN